LKRGVGLVQVFHSPADALRELATGPHALPFPVVADPGKVAYRLFHVGGSWASLWSIATGRAFARTREAAASGLRPRWRDVLRDGAGGSPADFLIAPDGTVARAHYGAHFADSLSPAAALAWIDELPGRAAAPAP